MAAGHVGANGGKRRHRHEINTVRGTHGALQRRRLRWEGTPELAWRRRQQRHGWRAERSWRAVDRWHGWRAGKRRLEWRVGSRWLEWRIGWQRWSRTKHGLVRALLRNESRLLQRLLIPQQSRLSGSALCLAGLH